MINSKLLQRIPLLLLSAVISGNTVAQEGIKGNIEGVKRINTANAFIKGWACNHGSAESIKVELAVGGEPGKGGTTLKTVVANKSSDESIDNQCGATGTPHRFKISLSLKDRMAFDKQPIYVLGEAADGTTGMLDNSGKYNMKAYQGILGQIGNIVHPEEGSPYIKGWACNYGLSKSINVHLYAGGPSGKGTFVKGVRTDLRSGKRIKNKCGSEGGSKHKFQIPLTAEEISLFDQQPIYVHGISEAESNKRNRLLRKSGKFLISGGEDDPISNYLGQKTHDFPMSDLIDNATGVHLAEYKDFEGNKVLVSWNTPDAYGVISEFSISPQGDFTHLADYDFNKQCGYLGGITASEDGSRVAALCKTNVNSFSAMDNRGTATDRPSGHQNIFTGSKFFNLLALSGPQGFYVGDIFTATEPGNDVLMLEFENGISNTPANVVLVSSASHASKYGHLTISRKPKGDESDLYYLAIKSKSNRDIKGIYHTDMKEIGVRPNSNGTYSRLRITDNYGTGMGVTHPDIAEFAYNEALDKWGRLSFGDAKTSWATIPNYLIKAKGNQNPAENMYEEYSMGPLFQKNPRNALKLLSLAQDGFMGLTVIDGVINVKQFPGVVSGFADQNWKSLGLNDVVYGNMTYFSADKDAGDRFLVGWSPEEGAHNVQLLDKNMNLVGESQTLNQGACWASMSNWAFVQPGGNTCAVFACTKDSSAMRLTSVCNN